MSLFRSFLIISLGFSGIFLHPISNDTQATYCNERFQFCLDYPKNIFTQEIISPNDDGLQLHSEKGLDLRVFGYYNTLKGHLEAEHQEMVQALIGEMVRVNSTTTQHQHDYFETILVGSREEVLLQTFERGNSIVSLILHKAPSSNWREQPTLQEVQGKISLRLK